MIALTTFTNKNVCRIGLAAILLAALSFTNLNAQIIIEAEDYSQQSGIQTEGTSDIGGGLNVGWIDNGDWLEYEVTIPVNGDYIFKYRTASENGGGLINLKNGDISLLTVNISQTGAWQNWTTESSTAVNLTAGTYTYRIEATIGGFNLNWWSITLDPTFDTDAPTTPGVTVDSSDVHNAYITLDPSTDTTSIVTHYNIYSSGNFHSIVTDTIIRIASLSADSTYQLSISATDLAGNESATVSFEATTDTIPWELAWSDEFDYTGKPSEDKWYFETGGHGWGNGELQYYSDGDNANVDNGVLTIETRKEAHGSNDFTSSRINSARAVDFLYGRVEVKAKLPKTKGSWPAIWTLPSDWVYGGWPECGEIDIMEHSDLTGYGHVFSTIHTGAYNHQDGTQKSGGITFDDVTDTYHTYTLEWYPDSMNWFVDDVQIFHFDNEYKTKSEWPYDIPHHLLLNVAVGGGLGGPVDYNGVWPQEMVVDYVRVYDFKLNDNDTIAPDTTMKIMSSPASTTADISWYIAKDNYAIQTYYVYLDDELVDSTFKLSSTLKNLELSTEYTVGIQAKDYSGNLSAIANHTFTTTNGLALNSNNVEELKLFPNPLNGSTLTIEVPTSQKKVLVSITSMDGKTLYQIQVNNTDGTVELNNLNLVNGLFVVSLITDKNTYTQLLKVN